MPDICYERASGSSCKLNEIGVITGLCIGGMLSVVILCLCINILYKLRLKIPLKDMNFFTKMIFERECPELEIGLIGGYSLLFLCLYGSTIYYFVKIKDELYEEQLTKKDDVEDNFKLFTDIGISCCTFGLCLCAVTITGYTQKTESHSCKR